VVRFFAYSCGSGIAIQNLAAGSSTLKNKITPIDRGREMREDDFIVSKTDLKGRLTYGNPIFWEFSQFLESDMLGKQHNIVRHPDMPRSVFHFMWTTLKAGNEFFGCIKNMAKDGSYYWTMANVTPSYDETDKLLGYFSVRRKPSQSATKDFSVLYKAMLEEEKRVGPKAAISAGTAVLENHIKGLNSNYEKFIFSYISTD